MILKPKFLLVDDDPAVRDTFVMMILQSTGVFAEVASDGLEALQLIERQQPDILITDTNMPNKNGLELMQEVRTKYPQILIYSLFSGLENSDLTKEDVCALGASMVLEKNEFKTQLLPALESFVIHKTSTLSGD